MPASVRHILFFFILPVVGVALFRSELTAQDISRYSVTGGGNLFKREVDEAILRTGSSLTLPRLDCAVEYLRRAGAEEIVYRRGPIDLHLSHTLIKEAGITPGGGYPASSEGASSNFQGGLLLDLPRAGETSEDLVINPSGHRYMLRVAIIPESYAGATLRARVILERAVVTEELDQLRVLSSEVFSRPVELEGNLPLKFDLPIWEAVSSDAKPLVPASLQEAVLLTLETPRYFALPPTLPEPFKGRTLISYAVPIQSVVRLSIRVQGNEQVLDEGPREAGTYDIAWNAGEIPDGGYTATLVAKNSNGEVLFQDERSLTKNIAAQSMATPRTLSAAQPQTVMPLISERRPFSVGIESGISYQFPADASRSLRNMFTHVAFRAGFRLLPWLELGIVAGQDAFHEYPGETVDVEHIPDFGGVVAWTYGYAGPYIRYLPGEHKVAPFVQLSTLWSDAATLAEVAGGVRIAIWPQIEGYFGPALLAHFMDNISTKIGIHYGMTVRF